MLRKSKKSGCPDDWKSSLFNIRLGSKLGGKVKVFNNFYLRKITSEKIKKPHPTLWFLAEYLITAWLADEERGLRASHCSDMLYGLILLSSMDCAERLSFPCTISGDTTGMIQQEARE